MRDLRQGWQRIMLDAARFYFNKIRYGLLEPFAGRAVNAIEVVWGGGLLKEIRVFGKTGLGRLPYCEMRDASGIRRVFQLPWVHVENILDCTDDKTRLLTMRRLLAMLPCGACCNFVLGRNLTHADVVAETFRRIGFRVVNVDTFYYQPPANVDNVFETLTSKSIKIMLRQARRELELVDVSPREFVKYYKDNIEASGKNSYFDLETDRVLFELGVSTGRARIVGARRKATAERPGPFPLDAAMVCTWSPEQDNYKFIRLTHRSRVDCAPGEAPHKNASKLLILAAMEDAAALGLPFETDGTTPGMTKVYAMFGPGVFRPAVRIQCMRDTIWSLAYKEYPSIARRIARITRLGMRPPLLTSSSPRIL